MGVSLTKKVFFTKETLEEVESKFRNWLERRPTFTPFPSLSDRLNKSVQFPFTTPSYILIAFVLKEKSSNLTLFNLVHFAWVGTRGYRISCYK